MSSPLPSSYMRLIQTIQRLEHPGPYEGLVADSVRLLEIIAVAHVEGDPMAVSTAMRLSAIASPASIHRKLEQLRVANLITHQFNDGNRRTKYLAPTPLTLKHYDLLSAEMMKIKTETLLAQ